jgi:hypothetical protein
MDISQSIEDAISAYFHSWFQEHQLIWWLISNPLWSLVIVLLSIALLVSLVGAISRGLEQLWLGLLRTPLRLLRPTTGWLWETIIKTKTNNSLSALSAQDRQIDGLVKRLCQIQQEQDKLMKELLKIVKAEP